MARRSLPVRSHHVLDDANLDIVLGRKVSEVMIPELLETVRGFIVQEDDPARQGWRRGLKWTPPAPGSGHPLRLDAGADLRELMKFGPMRLY
jgi:hypothetical protein